MKTKDKESGWDESKKAKYPLALHRSAAQGHLRLLRQSIRTYAEPRPAC